MANEQSHKEHEEMLTHLIPFVEYLERKGFCYFITIGKDESVARYVNQTENGHISDILTQFASDNPQVARTFVNVLENLKQ